MKFAGIFHGVLDRAVHMILKWLIVSFLLVSSSVHSKAIETNILLAGKFTTCSAYFFNATKMSPAREYEKLFRLGEKSANRARSLSGSADIMREVGDASDIMMDAIERDFRRFSEIATRYAAPCKDLLFLDAPIK